MTMSRHGTVLTFVFLAAGPALMADGALCPVPTASHPTIQAAVDDASCTEVELGAQTYAGPVTIDRSLSMWGAGSGQTFVEGQVEVSAGTVELQQMHLAAATEALWVHSGAQVDGFDLEVVSGLVPGGIYADGFESGDTSAWSSVVP